MLVTDEMNSLVLRVSYDGPAGSAPPPPPPNEDGMSSLALTVVMNFA
jgi:hypothetical protein|eukprot:COSAG02_NODE_1102_length_14571_cov_27.965243_10_plen_47_part_00